MTNLERYNKIFMSVFRKKEEELKGLKYRELDLWDSIGHMDLVAELEEVFEIRLETSDMLDLTSYERGLEVLAEYGVAFEEAEEA